MLLWDAFLEDYNQEIWDWTLRETLETFWHYCQGGNKSVHELQIQKHRDKIHEIKEIE